MKSCSTQIRKSGFTLIELLIVVAIIAILAAIAVPNFLEAQIRAKVGRVKSDMRTVGIAIESYAIDYNGKYPILNGYLKYVKAVNCINRGSIRMGTGMTTPVAYLSSTTILDPFAKSSSSYNEWGDIGNDAAVSNTVCYLNVALWWKMDGGGVEKDPLKGNRPKWFLASLGPDYKKGPNPYPQLNPYNWAISSYGGGDNKMKNIKIDDSSFSAVYYDPSNGSVSGGDVVRHQ